MTDLHADLTACPADASPETLRELSDRVLLLHGWTNPGGQHGYWYSPDGRRYSWSQWPGRASPAANLQDAVALTEAGTLIWGNRSAMASVYPAEGHIQATTPALAVCAALVQAMGER